VPASWIPGRRLRAGGPFLLTAAAVVWYLAWEVAHRGVYGYLQSVYPIDPADEWRYTACSRLVGHGYQLFNQVFSAQPPLLFLSLAGGMRIAGDSITGARFAEVTFGLVTLISAAVLAWVLGGRWTAAVTAVLLAVSPGFLVYAHTVEAEGPMMALATLSLALAALTRTRGAYVAAPAGLALAAAVLMKLFAVEAVLPASWLIVTGSSSSTGRWRVLGAFFACAATPVALNFALVSPLHQWQQVVSLHDRAASLALPGLLPPADIVRRYVEMDIGLTALCVAGLIALALAARWRLLVFAGLWLGGTLVMLLLFRPLFPHHAAILEAPLALTAGLGFCAVWAAGGGAWRPAALATLAGVLLYLVALPHLAEADRHVLMPVDRSPVYTLARFVDARTPAGSFAALDNLEVADAARRLVPPPLCDPSNVRRLAGYLTASDLIGATRRYRPALVLSQGIYTQVPDYLAWLRTHYRPVRAPAGVAFAPR